MTTSTESEANTARSWCTTYMLALMLVLLAAWPTLFFPFGRDQGIHATIGYALGEGLVTYSDVYNIKPPVTTLIHLLSQTVFGHSMSAIRSLDLIFAALTVLGLVSIVRRGGLPPEAGAFTAFGFVLIYYSQTYWENSQTDGWAGFLVVPAVLAMMSAWDAPAGAARNSRMFLAGVILGLAFVTKYTMGVAGILVFAPLLAGRRAGFFLGDFLSVILGGVIVLAIFGLLMSASGALGPFLEIQSFIKGYVGYSSQLPVYSQLLLILKTPLVVAMAAAGLLAWIWGLREREARLLLIILALWLVAAGISGLVQGKAFQYHFLPMVPPYALLLGLAGWRLVNVLRRSGMRHTKLTAVLIATGLAVPSDGFARVIRGVSALAGPSPVETLRADIPPSSDFDSQVTIEFSELMSRHRAPGDRFFVWGYETMLYFLQKEPPYYRYPYAWPFVVDFYDGRYTEDLLSRLNSEPPKHIVVQKRDATPWVTGRDQSSKDFLDSFEAFSGFLNAGYRLVEDVPRFELWERR